VTKNLAGEIEKNHENLFTILNNLTETAFFFFKDDQFIEILKFVIVQMTMISLEKNMLSRMVSISIIICYLIPIILLHRSYW